jgi:hypothetical protein
VEGGKFRFSLSPFPRDKETRKDEVQLKRVPFSLQKDHSSEMTPSLKKLERKRREEKRSDWPPDFIP